MLNFNLDEKNKIGINSGVKLLVMFGQVGDG